MTNRTRTAVVALAGTLVAFGMLSACAPQPEPEPEPTAVFASEEEAFAAAEETYRAYIEDFNQAKAAGYDDFDLVLSWLGGEMERDTRKMFSAHEAEGLRLVGDSTTRSFSGDSANLEGGAIIAHVCEEVAGVDLIDAQGTSHVSSERPDIQSLLVTLQVGDTPTSLRITSIEGAEAARCSG